MSFQTDLCHDLKQLGVAPSDKLLVHSSLKSIGSLDRGASELFDALLHAVREGTLLLPALSYETVDAQNPYFDANTTPSCIGAAPEIFRSMPGVRRSLNPTHSIAAKGLDADWLTGSHHLDDTPVGPHSPLAHLRDACGKILFLGCGLEPNTSMHGVEELTNPSYLFLPEMIEYHCTDALGQSSIISCKRHNFREGSYVFRQRYDRITEVLDGRYIRSGKVGNADCYLLDTAPMWEAAEKAMRHDPLFFVDRELE